MAAADSQRGDVDAGYAERLRLVAINDARLDDRPGDFDAGTLDSKASAFVHIAALVATGGAVPTYTTLVDDALGAGATCDEIVDVLLHVIAVTGKPRVVAEAPKLALALGYDIDESFEPPR
jgi:alkylhydroperoxidase/carboxymuconolactone decarboxylase family protein YurZ